MDSILIILIVVSLYLAFACFALVKLSKNTLLIIFLLSILSGSILVPFGDKHVNIFFSDFIFLIVAIRCSITTRYNLKKTAKHKIQYNFSGIGFTAIKNSILLVILFYGIYAFFGFVSFLIVSPDRVRSLYQVVEITKNILYMTVIFHLLRNDERSIQIVLSWIPVVGLGCAIMVIFAGFNFLTQGGEVHTLFNLSKSYVAKNKITSILGRNNYLAALLVFLLPVTTSVTLRKRIGITWIIPMVIIVALFMTGSRGAILSLIIGISIVLIASCSINYISIFLMSSLSFFLYFIFTNFSMSPFIERIRHSFVGRFLLWQSGFELFVNNALFSGIGIGIYRTVFDSSSVHNCILTAYIETGLIGGSAFLLSLLFLALGLLKKYFKLRRVKSASSHLFLGILLSLSVGLVHSMGEPLLGQHAYDSLFWPLMAIAFAFPVPKSKKSQLKQLQSLQCKNNV